MLSMNKADPQQSFTATLSIDKKAVVLYRRAIQKQLDDPQTGEELRNFYQIKLDSGSINNLLTIDENLAPELFLFEYVNGVYIIRIQGANGAFSDTISMEGDLRNLSVFEGDDPTYFRIKDDAGAVIKLDDIPLKGGNFLLYTGPQHREVCTYGEQPNFPVITDYVNRGGPQAIFNLNIITRATSTGH